MTNFPRGNGLSQQLLAVTKRGNCCHFRQLETERSNKHPMRPGRTTPHHTRRWTQELSYWLPITLPREFFFTSSAAFQHGALDTERRATVGNPWKPDFFPGRVFPCLAFRDARWTRPPQWVRVLSHDCGAWQSITFLLRVPGSLRVNYKWVK